MTQTELDREVARATGESTLRRPRFVVPLPAFQFFDDRQERSQFEVQTENAPDPIIVSQRKPVRDVSLRWYGG